MRIGIVGCGFVADNYIAMLAEHPELTLVGVYDRDPDRLSAFARFHRLHAYDAFSSMLGDERVQMIVNLTNPGSHYEITMAALRAGRHVYSGEAARHDHAGGDGTGRRGARDGTGLGGGSLQPSQ